MTDEAREHQIRQFVAAFADGELDLEQTIEVLSRLTIDPATTARVDHQQRLREAVRRVMRGPECRGHSTRCPEAIRREIERVCRDAAASEPSAQLEASPRAASSSAPSTEPDNPGGPARHGVLASLGRWFPLAAAAALLLVGAAGLYVMRGTGVVPFEGRIVNAALAQQFDVRHTACSTDVSELYNHLQFPENVEALPEAVAGTVGHSIPGLAPLDLSIMGYRYVRAGRCEVPGEPAVHVIYRAEAGGSDDALSVWVTTDRGQIEDLEKDRLYMAQVPETGHPLVLWRRGGLVYYLLGETLPAVESAANILPGREGHPDAA